MMKGKSIRVNSENQLEGHCDSAEERRLDWTPVVAGGDGEKSMRIEGHSLPMLHKPIFLKLQHRPYVQLSTGTMPKMSPQFQHI